MSLGLLFPLGLAALAAAIVPLLLHLARREEQKPTDFAALRWLSAKLRPRQKLRFEEWPLLLVRIALVAALALLLARPVLTGTGGDAPWLLVLPGAEPGDLGDLPDGTQRRWLAPGFPPLETPMPTGEVPVASLLRQLDAELPAATPLAVREPPVFAGADGERPRLSRPVDWRVVGGPSAPPAVAEAPSFALAIRHDVGDEDGLRYLRAAAVALQPPGADGEATAADVAGIDAPLPPHDRALAWWSAGDLPAPVRAWLAEGGTLLIGPAGSWPLPAPGQAAWRDEAGDVLAQAAAFERGRVVQLLRAPVPEQLPAVLDADFPARLESLLRAPPAAPTWADARAYAPEPGGAAFPETPRDLAPMLLWAVLALFALERWLATGRREARA